MTVSQAPSLMTQMSRSAEIPSGSRVKIIWSLNSPRICELVSGKADDAKLFNDILTVRTNTDPRWPNQSTSVDPYSDHYCMFVEGNPVGSLGVTRALDGDIFLQEFCPPQLLDEFGDTLVSAYRFRILKDYRKSSALLPGVSLSRHLVRETWRDQISRGTGLDLINIEKSHVILYQRMGYVHCEGYDYIDPVLGTASCLMFLPVDPDRESIIQDIIRVSDIRISLAQVMACLTHTRVYVNGVGR